MVVKVGELAPDFTLKSHDGRTVRLSDYRGKTNVALAFFPLAWTPVCTSQVPAYQASLARFEGMKTQVLALSVDSTDCLRAWTTSLGGITYPVLSDFFPHGQVAQLYGVLRAEGYAERAIFVIDKQGIVRYVDVHDIGQQPDNDEIFRVLNELEPEAAAAMAAADRAAAAAAPMERPTADVILYCTPWCSDCRQARAWLQARSIPYVEVNISKDRAAAAKVRGWAGGFETTPTFDIKGQIIVDWQPDAVARALSVE